MTTTSDTTTRRVPPAPAELSEPLFGEGAATHLTILAWNPELAQAVCAWMNAVYTTNSLDPRLVELIRLRVAFHNQCRTCMATRNQEVGVTEELVCSLERPQEAEDLSDAERAALAYADLMASDHHSITDDTYARLHDHFTREQVVELGVLCAGTIGMGRLLASWDILEGLPDRFQENRGDKSLTPWGDGEVLVNTASMSGNMQSVKVPGLHR